jgi:TRAP-type mannitol/chloroaromatic compound transport system permease small subunit
MPRARAEARACDCRDLPESPTMSEATDTGFPPTDGPFHRVAAALSALGSLWIVALMLLVVADVVGRSLLNNPITGVAEVAGRSIVAIVFLQLAAAVLQGRMTRSDLVLRLLGRVSARAVAALEVLFALAAALAFALILRAAWPNLTQTWATGEFFGVQGVFTIPLWPFRALMVGGVALAVLAALLVAAREAAVIWRRR